MSTTRESRFRRKARSRLAERPLRLCNRSGRAAAWSSVGAVGEGNIGICGRGGRFLAGRLFTISGMDEGFDRAGIFNDDYLYFYA